MQDLSHWRSSGLRVYAELFDLKGLNEMLAAKGMRFPIDVILVCIRWYAAYPLSYRHLEEMMEERGVVVV